MDQKLLEIERKSLIIRKVFETSKLVEKYPPKMKSVNKKIIYDIACPINSNHNGELIFSKWSRIDCLDMKFKVKSSTIKLIME